MIEKDGKRYISAIEFAEIVGISPQSVYKQWLKGGRLSSYVIAINRHRMIDIQALGDVYGLNPGDFTKTTEPTKTTGKPTEPTKETTETTKEPTKTTKETTEKTTGTTDYKDELIRVLTKENQEKAELIQRLNERIDYTMKLLDQQQQLTLVAENRIKMLEAQEKSQEEPQSSEEPQDESPEESPAKLTWWERIKRNFTEN